MFQNKSNAARAFKGLLTKRSGKLFFALCVSLLPLVASPLFGQELSLLDESSKKGQVLYWDTLTQSGVLEKNGKQVSFRAGSNVILLDNEKFAFTDAPQIANGQISVSQKFIQDSEEWFSLRSSSGENFKVGAILIDPGHGGKDPGALMTHKINGKKVTIKEKDINLSVAKMLAARLKAAYPQKQIIMTRSSDVFITLQQRTEIANSVKLKDHEAVLYISIHVNSSLDKKARGYEVWYLSPGYRRTVLDHGKNEDPKLFPILNSMMEEEYTTESILIAKFIMDGLAAQIGNLSSSRGIKAEEWFVVRNSNMPSVLVEVGFVSNYEEAKLLNDESYLQKTAFGIYNGIAAFVTHFERSRGFTGTK
ncbi:MAG: N-acetylmuramoyl-L-alanine amidase [Treponema sp.]|nr:N-acetylmuramoyl-L-alanine amidase [Treponema sp.]